MTTVESENDKVSRLREELPAAKHVHYFNSGANGPIPIRAHQAMIAVAEEELREGRAGLGYFPAIWERAEAVRAEVARCFNASPADIALARSSNEGLNIVLSGIEWQRGDEVITTQLEHPGLLTPLCLIANQFGVRIRLADIGNGGGDVLGAIEAHLSPRTRAIALSHVMWSSGAIMPLCELSDLAHNHGALLIVDGAQGAGQAMLDLRDRGVDAYAMSGQKWLLGPEGTGALYVRSDRLNEIHPTRIRYAQSDLSGFLLPAPGARRFEMGETNGAAITGQKVAHQWIREDVGFAWAIDRIARNGKRLRDALKTIDGVSVFSPDDAAGLVCYTVDGWKPDQIASVLADQGYATRYVVYPPGPAVARASCGWWNTDEELDGLAAAIAELATRQASDLAAD